MNSINISEDTLKRLRYENIKLYYETIFNSEMYEEFSYDHVNINASYLKNNGEIFYKFRSKTFLELNEEEQKQYIENASTINILKFVLDDNIFNKYYDEYINLIIKDQDVILFYMENWGTNLLLTKEEVDKIIDIILHNSLCKKKISDENLVKLLFTIDKNLSNLELLIDEVEDRLRKGHVIFDGHSMKIPFLFGDAFEESLVAFSKLPEDIRDMVRKNGKANWDQVPRKYKNIDWKGNGLFQQLNYSKLYLLDKLNDKGLNILNELLSVNPNIINEINFELLNDEIIDILGSEYIKNVCCFDNITYMLLTLYKNDRELFISYANIIKEYFKEDTLKTGYIVSEQLLTFFFDNNRYLKKIDLTALNRKEFINYVLFIRNQENNLSLPIRVNYSSNYKNDFNNTCNNLFNDTKIATEMKDIFFQKYYSMGTKEAKNLVDQFYNELNKLRENNEYNDVCDMISLFKTILDTNDKDKLKEIYYSHTNALTQIEYLEISNRLKEYISNSYVDKLNDIDNKINKLIKKDKVRHVDYEDSDITIVPIEDDFSFIVYSSDTGYKGEKELVNNNYVDSWYQIDKGVTHGIATSYISNINIGSAPVTNSGVLYAFTHINPNNILAMSSHDINSHISNYGGKSGEQNRFLTPDNMSLNTVRIYNEIMIERNSIKPDYIIIYTGCSDENIKSALKCAKEWNIPIIEINKTKLATNQMNNIKKLIEKFKKSKDLNDLEYIINLLEANMSGYKLNSINNLGDNDLTASIDNEYLRHIFDPKLVEDTVIEYAYHADNNELDKLLTILNNIMSKYEIANKMNNKYLPKVDTNIKIDVLIELVKSLKNDGYKDEKNITI